MAVFGTPEPDGDAFGSFFKKLAAGVPGVLFTYWLSADGQRHRYPYIGDQVRTLFDLEPADLNQNADGLFAILHPDDAEGVPESIRASARTLQPWHHQARLRLCDGRYNWFEAHSEPERQSDGSTVWYGQFHNIQHYKDLEASLRRSQMEFAFQAGFQNLIARLSAGFINLEFGNFDECIDELLRAIGEFFALDRTCLYRFSDDYRSMSNTHECCATGVPAMIQSRQNVAIDELGWWRGQVDSMVGGSQVVFVDDTEQLPVEAELEKAMLRQLGVASFFCVPIRMRGRVAGYFGVDSVQRRAWRKDQAELLVIVAGLLSGVLERQRLEENLLNQSIRDPLTDLHNRRYLMPRLEEMLGRSARYGERFALAMFDLDHFKDINDALGHLGGDYILQRFAELLLQHTRTTDVVVRFGGEEFLVVFTSVESDDVRRLVLRVLEAVREEIFVFAGQCIAVTVSAGVAGIGEFTGRPATPEAIIGAADHRLYLAKQAGRDCLVDASGTQRI